MTGIQGARSSAQAGPGASGEHRSLWWWISVALTPLGILGGPLELATLTSGLIEWHGPIGFVVNFWGETITQPFHTIFEGIFVYLSSLLGILIVEVPRYVTDYLVLGILLASSIWRAYGWGGQRLRILPMLGICLVVICLWPICLFFLLRAWLPRIPGVDTIPSRPREVEARTDFKLGLILAPFVIFLLLFGLNALLGATAT